MSTPDPVRDPARLASLHATGLTNGAAPAGAADFDRLTELAARLLGVPVCLVSLVDSDRQVFAGACGLPAPYDQSRQTPISHSFCQHAVRQQRPLVIRDARRDPLVADNGAVRDLSVLAYVGFPLVAPDGHTHGAFCVIDTQPRDWSEAEIAMVRELTAVAADQLELHLNRTRDRSSLDVLLHDLKSPLSGVQMIAGVLRNKEQELPDPLRPLVEALGESADRALHLLASMARRDRAASLPGDRLAEVLREVADRHRTAAAEKGVSIELVAAEETASPDVEGWVVEQVAENLLSNAIKFTPPGGTIHLRNDLGDDYARFEIEDGGPGFSAEDYPRLFRRYARLSARPTAGEESTGLGLSIVKRLLDQEGGRIELLSQPGESARFRVSLPRA